MLSYLHAAILYFLPTPNTPEPFFVAQVVLMYLVGLMTTYPPQQSTAPGVSMKKNLTCLNWTKLKPTYTKPVLLYDTSTMNFGARKAYFRMTYEIFYHKINR